MAARMESLVAQGQAGPAHVRVEQDAALRLPLRQNRRGVEVIARTLPLLFVVASVASAQTRPTTMAPPKEKLDVYLLIGQSNMAGRAPIEEEDKAPVEHAYVLNGSDTWEPATNP